jgi:hypothetical protein
MVNGGLTVEVASRMIGFAGTPKLVADVDRRAWVENNTTRRILGIGRGKCI